MIANFLRNLTNRYWPVVLAVWLVIALTLHFTAKSWKELARDGDLEYLPKHVTSLQGEKLLKEAFPNERARSQIVLVFARGGEPLNDDDRVQIAKVSDELRGTLDPDALVDLWDLRTDVIKEMLVTPQGKPEIVSAMVVAKLTNGLMDVQNVPMVHEVERTVNEAMVGAPEGLKVGITGSAVIGGDMRASMEESLKSTELTTVLLVLGCLILIYRSPLLVFVPLATIGLSLMVSYDVVALLAEHFGPDKIPGSSFKIFTTTKIFVVVILFGAGTDFCLFLIARLREELAAGHSRTEAAGLALQNVTGALAGSAFTTILGLSMMAFAQYGKFVSSGPIVALCLFITLIACLTFTPALLRALGPLVFWPFGKKVLTPAAVEADEDPTGLWHAISNWVIRRPGTILFVSAWLAAPLIFHGTKVHVTHDLMADLDPQRMSVRGADMMRQYFQKGAIAPLTVVAELANGKEGAENAADLNAADGKYTVGYLHAMLHELDIVKDVRSLYLPVGGDPRNKRWVGGTAIREGAIAGSPLAKEAFVSHIAPHAGRVTQLSVVLDADPFAQEARDMMPRLQKALADFAANPPDPAWKGARFELAGTTPGMFDLERITNSDRTRIQVLVLGAVYVVLIVLLRRPIDCTYLILTVLLSYWATIGLTQIFFEWLYGDSFHGLDWKVPIFLFVILIAIGQDYNIYLATRVYEEQAKLGKVKGLKHAVVQTGGIITSCGVIMAGTFIAMATGTLRSMIELGFSLALGVLLDTFFVRSIIVPCFYAIRAKREERREAEKLQQLDSDPGDRGPQQYERKSAESLAAN